MQVTSDEKLEHRMSGDLELFLASGLALNLFSVGWVGGQKPGTEIQVTGAGWTMLGGQLVQTRLAMYTLTVLYIRTMVLTCEHREVRDQGLRSR